jgi:hypothetical protein
MARSSLDREFLHRLPEPSMSRALLVIDVQNEYFSGALPIT